MFSGSVQFTIRRGHSVRIFRPCLCNAPCILEEISVRHVELGELESRGARIIYAVQLQQLDREIKRLQPDILAPVKYQNTALIMDSDRHHRQMGYKMVVVERIVTQHGSVHYLGPVNDLRIEMLA